MSVSQDKWIRIAISSAVYCGTSLLAFWLLRDVLDPDRKRRQQLESDAEKLLRRLAINSSALKLNSYEYSLAANIVLPGDGDVCWNDIGGLDEEIANLKLTVMMPLTRSIEACESPLLTIPKGVLLYGPPGCGKTMIAKALANEAGARFISLQASSLMDKYYGETQKLTDALFSLALKIQPCIVFVDEIDALLRKRNSSDHEVTAIMKTQFLAHIDGLQSNQSAKVLIIGATNRRHDLDEAILRRLACTFYIGLPTLKQRVSILSKLLKGSRIAEDVSLYKLAEASANMSGANLQEVCRRAAFYAYKRFVSDASDALVLTMCNFESAFAEIRSTEVNRNLQYYPPSSATPAVVPPAPVVD